jgi:hypothetical protein
VLLNGRGSLPGLAHRSAEPRLRPSGQDRARRPKHSSAPRPASLQPQRRLILRPPPVHRCRPQQQPHRRQRPQPAQGAQCCRVQPSRFLRRASRVERRQPAPAAGSAAVGPAVSDANIPFVPQPGGPIAGAGGAVQAQGGPQAQQPVGAPPLDSMVTPAQVLVIAGLPLTVALALVQAAQVPTQVGDSDDIIRRKLTIAVWAAETLRSPLDFRGLPTTVRTPALGYLGVDATSAEPLQDAFLTSALTLCQQAPLSQLWEAALIAACRSFEDVTWTGDAWSLRTEASASGKSTAGSASSAAGSSIHRHVSPRTLASAPSQAS